MDRKPKVGGAKKPKEKEKSQSERFIETARSVEADETGQAFERAVRKVLTKRKTEN